VAHLHPHRATFAYFHRLPDIGGSGFSGGIGDLCGGAASRLGMLNVVANRSAEAQSGDAAAARSWDHSGTIAGRLRMVAYPA
jgi:hypothetical protein